MFAVEDEDWLQKFIQDYKDKLAKERLELSSITSDRVMKSQQQQACHEVEKEQTAEEDDTICSTPSLENTLEVMGSSKEHSADLMTSIGRDERREAVDRKKKQEEYHRILDQQFAEKKQRKLQEKLLDNDVDDLKNTTSHETIRSPSPPIKSHYRNFVPNRVPSRPLSANQQRLSDLTELRQLYSNR